MRPITKAQRVAIKRVYDRAPILPYVTPEEQDRGIKAMPITYRQFRRSVQQGYDCLMVNWKGMWLGIEPDGYTHS